MFQLLDVKTEEDLNAILDTKEASVVDHIGWPPGQSFTVCVILHGIFYNLTL